MNDDPDLYARLCDRVLWALESTSLGHHPAAAHNVVSSISHLNFTAGRDQAISLATEALGAFTPSAEEAASTAARIVDRLALDETPATA